jgi:hypothetical protein
MNLRTSSRRIALQVLVFIAASSPSWANPLDGVGGYVPLAGGQRPATDLVDPRTGEILLPDELESLRRNGTDLSTLEPDPSSDLWQEDGTGPLPSVPELGAAEVRFESTVLSRTGNFRFVGRAPEISDRPFTFLISKTAHTALLRKSLLEKLGYRVPEIRRVPRLRLSFATPAGKELFLQEIAESTLGAPERWVVNQKEERTLELQDLLVMDSVDAIYNLALGALPSSVIQGRRALNGLHLAYGLTSLSESVNLLSWHAGRVVSQHLELAFDGSEEFTPNFDDARWMSRRLARLSREDLRAVVASTELPEPVQRILVEKLVSRRNQAVELFLGTTATPLLPFDPAVTAQPCLVSGKLTCADFPGYGSRFSYGDPESPLSSHELLAFTKSKLISNVLSNLVRYTNENFLPRSDLQGKLIERQQQQALDHFVEFLKTGKTSRTPVAAFAIPTWGGNLIASRDVILGAYLGTDNPVQVADSVGFQVNAGAFIGVDGIAAPWAVSGTVRASLTRTFSHIKPIKSIRVALKQPFKNILVPLVNLDYADLFRELIGAGFSTLPEEERQERLTQIFKTFQEQMDIGESLVITDSIGAELRAGVGAKVTDALKAYLELGANQTAISRVHIHRKNENLIQVYKDLGNARGILVSVGLQAMGMPIIRFSAQLQSGGAQVRFSELNIDPDLKRNPKIVEVAGALRSLLLTQSLEAVHRVSPPYSIHYDFGERTTKFSLLFFEKAGLKSDLRMKLKHPEGDSIQLFRLVSADRKGTNFEQFGTELINAILLNQSHEEFLISSASNGLPGDSILGDQFTRSLAFDAIYEDLPGNRIRVQDPYLSLSYQWRGWSLSRRELDKILASINGRHQFHFFAPPLLPETRKVLLYRVKLDYQVYSEALDHLDLIDKRRFRSIAERFLIPKSDYGWTTNMIGGSTHSMRPITRGEYLSKLAWKWGRTHSSLLHARNRGDLKGTANALAELVSLLELNLQQAGLSEAFGGNDRYHVTARIEGFREGDESGDTPYLAHSLGSYGSKYVQGPVNHIRSRLGINEGEFLIGWLMGRF